MQQKKNIISITTSAANSCAAHTTTFMKHISMLALLLMAFALGARAVDYNPYQDGYRTRTDRKISTISLNDNTVTLTHSNDNGLKYVDLTSSSTFQVYMGETLSGSILLQNGNWVHGYIYIDIDSDGFTASIASDGYTPQNDLMTYSYYNGKNSAGNSLTNNNRNTLSMPSFIAPIKPGTYRMRYKVDWDNISPDGKGKKSDGGNTEFTSAGGTIVDVMLNVIVPTPVISISQDKKLIIANSGTFIIPYYSTDGVTYKQYDNNNKPTITIDQTIYAKNIYTSGSTQLESSVVSLSIKSIKTQDELSNISGNNYYILSNDLTLSNFESIDNFSGTLDGGYHTISGLTKPLFNTLNDGTVKNVVLKDVNVTGDGNVGSIACEATGNSRIYNCGVLNGTVSGTNYVGSIVGSIYGSSRVINSYSFADVNGGTWAAGIVGYNDFASNSNNLQTLVMNCFFYGDITAGTNIAPVYGGYNISNSGADGINNYNYFRASANINASVNMNINPTAYNCALASEELYLKRFEFYRYILNANRELCAYYVTGSVNNIGEIGKWVLDENIATYPVVKTWGKYPSVVNPNYAAASTTALPYQGKKLGELSVTVTGYGTVTLPITDMDTLRNDYNYYKVQLPYYKDYFSDEAIVTGWKITSVSGNTNNNYATSNFNFANRQDVGKDLHATSGRVFAQGGYYNVPEGVTAITIEPYKATKVVYLADATFDVTMSGTTKNAAAVYAGNRQGTYYNDIDEAIAQLPESGTVYDNAIVLVGNYHSVNDAWYTDTDRPFTIMSIDRDGDNEPDYGIYHYHAERKSINSIKFDFLNHCPIGMVHKETGTKPMLNIGIFHPKGWFEVSETCFPIYTEFEYNGNNKTTAIILNNGLYKQFVSSTYQGNTFLNSLNYMILGGHLYFDRLSPGCHPGSSSVTKHSPINILGGEFKEAYMSGIPSNCTSDPNDNPAYIYTNGGKIDFMAGAYMQPIKGDVTYKLNHSYIKEFYGGSVSALNKINGNINIEINHCLVGRFCGGPQFGDMAEGKKITTEAIGSIFNEYYGAGYGGTSLTYKMVASKSGTDAPFSNNSYTTFDNNYWTTWFQNVNSNEANNILVGYRTDFFFYAGGDALVHRFNQIWASFSLAKSYDISSTLTNCTINGNFYGGGCKGYVDGNAKSILNGCTVKGNAFAAGYTSSQTYVNVYSKNESPTLAYYNHATGLFTDTKYPVPVSYKWIYDTSNAGKYEEAVDGTNVIYTNQSFQDLGRITGDASITIKGNTTIEGSVYGGGNETDLVDGTATINIEGGTIKKNVFGGGNQGQISSALQDKGNTQVNITGGIILGNVFGGGNRGNVTGKTNVTIGQQPAVTP